MRAQSLWHVWSTHNNRQVLTREIFNWMSRVIRVHCFASVRFAFGLENLHDALNQSDSKLIPIDQWPLAFFRASSRLLVFTLSAHWLPVKLFFPWLAVVIIMVFFSQHWHSMEANFPRSLNFLPAALVSTWPIKLATISFSYARMIDTSSPPIELQNFFACPQVFLSWNNLMRFDPTISQPSGRAER